MSTPEQRFATLGLELPAPPPSAGLYVPGVRAGDLLFLSGCGPRRADGSYILGTVGRELDTAAGKAAARVAGLAMLARLRQVVGSLDKVRRIVKVLGMVNVTPEFRKMPSVIDGFSELMVEVFGEEMGRGARAAVGMASLTGGMAVEIEMVVQLEPGPG
jgi:enamine deaminase RidA (YjgF/YER057c/UK114 family)